MNLVFQSNDLEFGCGGGSALLRLPNARDTPLSARPLPLRLDLVTDLRFRIGSLGWWRGLITCTALCWATASFAPLEPLAGRSPAPLGDARQTRALGIAPLAYGGGTGRRMAPTAAVQTFAAAPFSARRELVAPLRAGEGLARLLERLGMAAPEAQATERMVAGSVRLADLKPGTRIALRLGRQAPHQTFALEFLVVPRPPGPQGDRRTRERGLAGHPPSDRRRRQAGQGPRPGRLRPPRRRACRRCPGRSGRSLRASAGDAE